MILLEFESILTPNKIYVSRAEEKLNKNVRHLRMFMIMIQ